MIFRTVSRVTEGLFRYQGWPTVCRDGDGTLRVAVSGNRLGHICPFGKDLIYTSTDEGVTWSPASVANDTPLDDRDAGLMSPGGRRLLLTWFNHPASFYLARRGKLAKDPTGGTEHLTDALLDVWEAMPPEQLQPGSFVRLSEDNGVTWGPKIAVPVTSPHGPALLRDGRLLYVGKEFYSGSYPEGHILAVESRDGGSTWQYLASLPFGPDSGVRNCHEPHCAELPDGTLLCAIRVQDLPTQPSFTVYLSRSADGGKSWTEPVPTGFHGSPPHLLVHSSGAVILTYGRREAPYGERARVSRNGGLSFGEELVISPDSYSSDLGYPSSVELKNGHVLTVYYQRFGNDPYDSVLATEWDPGLV